MKHKAEIQISNKNAKVSIIGMDGRNITTFQQEMGVEVLIDNTPNKIFLLAEDGRQLARACRVMEQLVKINKFTPDEIQKAKEVWGK